MCNVNRPFVPNFARTAASLNKLLQNWQPATIPALTGEQVREAVKKPQILCLPRADLPGSVDTHACDCQIGCALMQEQEDGTRHPISFWSRSLSPEEKNCSVGEK